LKEEALDRTLWRTCFAMSYGTVVDRPRDDDNVELF